jgi:hypothetical protein
MDPRQYSDIAQANIPYDVVLLPSHGMFYTSKVKELKVAYLTASDENLLSSPNLIESGNLIEELLRRKILGSDISVNDMLECDKQAVLIFLRNTSYGPVYEFNLKDPSNGTSFKYSHDLSKVRMRDFTLIPDEKDEYEFILPQTRKPLKFKFLTSESERELENLKEAYSTNGQIAPVVTRRLELLIQEIDGERNRENLSQIIQTMPIRDSQEFKKFVRNNQPGLDLSITVKAPSGEDITTAVVFGAHFFRPFFGV